LLPIAAAAGFLLVISALTSFVVLRLSAQGSGGTGQTYALHVSVEAAEEHRDALFDVELPPGIRLTSAAPSQCRHRADRALAQPPQTRPQRDRSPLLVDAPGALRVALHAGGRSLATTVQVGTLSASRPGSLLVAWRLEGSSPKAVRQ